MCIHRDRYNSTAMDWAPASIVRRWFDSDYGASDRLLPRWIFLGAQGLICTAPPIRPRRRCRILLDRLLASR